MTTCDITRTIVSVLNTIKIVVLLNIPSKYSLVSSKKLSIILPVSETPDDPLIGTGRPQLFRDVGDVLH